MKDQKLKAKFNAYNARGTTALFRAVESGDTIKIIDLLRKGADPNIASRKPRGVFGMVYDVPYPAGSTPLHVAALAGNLVVTMILLDYADPHRQNDKGETPLDAALVNLAFYEQCLATATGKKALNLAQTIKTYDRTVQRLIEAGGSPALFALPERLAHLQHNTANHPKPPQP